MLLSPQVDKYLTNNDEKHRRKKPRNI